MLNDFIFCPYSIYLHSVYMESDEDTYQATPQVRGSLLHAAIDTHRTSTKSEILMAKSVLSHELGIIGKIDTFDMKKGLLLERKYQLKNLYRGQLYQLWGQYYCLFEMGYHVEKIGFYEMSTRKTILQPIPSEKEKQELISIIKAFRRYSPADKIMVNQNKCRHCIYSNICDKTVEENVFS